MAEFKFSCPQCSQHIQCDTGYAGAQINCPTCNQSIVVPQPPRSAAAPPPPPLSIPTRHTAPAPVAASRQQVGLPAKQPAKSKTLRTVLVITAAVILVAALGVGSWFGFSKYKAVQAKKGNPAAQVATPTATSTVQALSVLSKVHSAYTNMTNVRMDDSVTVFLDLSNITVADVSPNQPAVKNSTRHPQGMPRVVENKTELSVRRSQTNLYYIAGMRFQKSTVRL
jgi:hypothetical protein